MTSQELRGRVALVTGSAGGIGAETVRELAAAGASVLATDVSDAGGTELFQELGESVRFKQADLRRSDEADRVVRAAVDVFGRLDIVFNNAGIGFNGALADHDDERIDRLLQVNLRSTIYVARSAIPHLLANSAGGVIINNASNGGVVGRAADPVYSASKHGVVGLTKSLALAHAADGIRVNAICPGPIDTPMVWANFVGVERGEAQRRVLASCPDPRIAHPREVAATVRFLASEQARFINGVALPIDGAKAAGIMPSDRYRTDFDFDGR